jgi:hypothetical protein
MSIAGCNQNFKQEDGNVCSSIKASGTRGTLRWSLCEDGNPNKYVSGCKCDSLTDIACGTTLEIKWALSSEGVLTISGKDDIPNYSYG